MSRPYNSVYCYFFCGALNITDVSQIRFEWDDGLNVGPGMVKGGSIGELIGWYSVLPTVGKVTLLAIEVSIVLLGPCVC